MNICIFRPGALGDLLVTAPVVEGLYQLYPHARILMITSSHWQVVARGFGGFLSTEDSSLLPLFAGTFDETGFTPEWLPDGGFDIVLAFLKNSDPELEAGFRSLGREYQRIESHPNHSNMAVIQSNIRDFLFYQLLPEWRPEVRPEGRWPLRGKEPALQWDPAGKELANVPWHRASVRKVSLHAGSGSSVKNWGCHRFLQLLDSLKKGPIPGLREVYWTIGPADSLVEEELRGSGIVLEEASVPLSGEGSVDPGLHVNSDLYHYVLKGDLAEMAAWIPGVDLFIGNDSGMAHLAAALGQAVLSIFGNSNPFWAPQGRHPFVRSVGGESGFPDVEEVLGMFE